MEQYAYFMVRVLRSRTETPEIALSGVVERITTGERLSFASAEELLRFLRATPVRANMPSSRDTRNP